MSTTETGVIPLTPRTMEEADKEADAAATTYLLVEKARRLAKKTQRRHHADLALFARYLAEAGIQTGNFQQDVEAWRGLVSCEDNYSGKAQLHQLWL